MPEEENKKAIRKAMQLLEMRERTERELQGRLLSAGYSEESTQAALSYVRSYGYLSDERYARHYILSYMHRRSRLRIDMDLKQKGFSSEAIREAWEAARETEDYSERELIASTIRKKYPDGTALSPKAYRNLQASLSRKGFSFEDIRAVLGDLGITQDYRAED